MQLSPDRFRVLHVRGPESDPGTPLDRTDERFDVTTATGTDEAHSVLADGTFDCVVAVAAPPAATRIGFVETIAERDPALPVVLTAADGSEALASRAIAAGVADYVPTAGDDAPAVVADRVVSAIEQSRSRRSGATRPSERATDGVDQAERELTPTEYREVFDRAEVGIGIIDPEPGRIEQVNRGWAEMLGYDPGELRGAAIEAISADDPRFDQAAALGRMREVLEGSAQQFDWAHEHADGTTIWCEVNLKRTRIGGEVRLLAFVRDVSERKRQEQRYRAFVEDSNDILSVLDESGVYQYQSRSVERVLGYESGELVGESALDYVHPEDRERVGAKLQQLMADSDADLVVEYRFRHADGSWRWLESRGLHQPDDSVIDGYVVNSRDATERKRHERGIADLHAATREMVAASDETDVCEVVVDTAESVLDQPITGVWLRDETGERLEPAATTESAEMLFDELPVYTEGNSLSWQAYENDETLTVDDVHEAPGPYNPESIVRSEIIVPLGEYGVLNVGSREPEAFSDDEIALTKLLGANAQVALGRSEREHLLERQTERMEFFNSILRHDVLNAVTVIRGRAQFLEADLEGQQREDAETIVRWSDDVEEIVGRVRTVLETLTGKGDPELEAVDLATELRAEIERVRATYPEVTFDTAVDRPTPVLANDLLGDVLGNVVTNAIDHNESDGLSVSVTATREDHTVLVRIADNGTGIDDDRKEAVFRRGHTGHAKSVGSGFGLFFVDAMVQEYGGDVWVEDNEAGGATFVLSLPAPVNGAARE